jgi:excinuclease UvrABC ATPase subunit
MNTTPFTGFSYNKSVEVIICPNCEGDGTQQEQHGSYETVIIDCGRCKGSGRLIRSVLIVPFDLATYQEAWHTAAKNTPHK